MRRAAETALGVDVGGTRIRVARIDRAGRILERIVEPVRADRAGFQEQLARLTGELRAPSDTAVGIGIPGRVDGHSGTILSAGYLDIAGLDLAGLIAERTGLPCRIENDATMALIAEMRARVSGPSGLVAMFTIGTGIGGAMLQDGRPWYGGGLSGQFGHIVVADDGPPCNCGRTGCVETFSSGTALGRLIAQDGLPETTRAGDLLARAKGGDSQAADLLERWARPLFRAIETIVSVTDPNLVLIGGGLGAEMTRALARLPSRSRWFSLPIEAAVLGDDAGVVGAGICGLDTLPNSEGGATA
ncbi:ROK family protein [Aurantimonas sp. VKM B-3413]|uniref:ROK family protein n=1 Tax=Aurantimonas sp. VKM B-3413 TaxID=2779401 RepID=UPI001E516DB9|nr:ROK family protein [Aurantimonas sp. VKM B-3413]MCB8836314.1 ROK family protein [Aurantimonas sp. VKM B-3413]